MKRGFLNSKPAKERPVASTNNSGLDPVPTQFPYAALDKPVEIPKGYETPLNILLNGSKMELPPDSFAYVWTTLPGIQLRDEPQTECVLLPESKDIILKTPGFPKPLPPMPTCPAFRVARSPGKGMGLFSTRNIKQGEIILYERPLLITPAAVRATAPEHFSPAQVVQHSLNTFERIAEVSVNRMTEERQAAFMSLHNCHMTDGSGPIVGRIRTNGFGLPGLQPGAQPKTEMEFRMGAYSVICENISRLNHSCAPNTAFSLDKAMLAYRLYAVRDIAEGEELTLQYVDVLCSKTQRQEALKPYDVTCACSVCTDPTTESDKRRSMIGSFIPTISAWAANRQLPDDWLIKKSTEVLDLIEKEGLEYFELYCIATHTIMEAYICLGDSENASKWAERVIRQPWSEEYNDQHEVEELLDPESPAYAKHGLWRMRVDENPIGELGAMFKMMGEICGPEGMKMMDNGGGMFMMLPNQNASPETLKKIADAMVKYGQPSG
ncbi:Aldehyde dehydrogenase [Mycena indigotica]|uniref:Aldehyde dehydrogenase n=1 Tax=Mycena indigotica TaxID=2126181 RepID=A0A8H6RYP7_9AGAR|nr:Aldehyde dehydrogenase [Mycena indigotica]KAF7289312.1 Aldehyde dehydrogenase [Mycena indigotica]